MSEYKPANIDALAKAMYQRECDYTGRDHEGYCVSENVKTLKSFEDEIARLTAEDTRKQGVINRLCVESGEETDLLRDCFPHVPDNLKNRMVDMGVVDIEDAPDSGRET